MKATSPIQHVTTTAFETEVLNAGLPVVVDLYASWCGPCRLLAPVLEKLAEAYVGRIKFVKVDVEQEPGLAERFGVTGVPTLLLFKDGAAVEEIVGFPPLGPFKEKLEELANPAPEPQRRTWRG